MSHFRRLAVIASMALVQACGHDPVSSRPAGRYEAHVAGEFERALSGTASVVMGRSGYGAPTVSIELTAKGLSDHITLTIARDALPLAGDYEIAPFSSEPLGDQWIGSYLASGQNESGGFFTALGGLVRITHSSPERLKGIFALDAEGAFGDGSTEPILIVVEGTFDAVMVPR